MRLVVLLTAALLGAAACSSPPKSVNTTPSPARRGAREVGSGREAALERRIAELELRLLERDAQIDELQSRLEETRGEVVRTMAKLQTVASRAEAASGMAEAEVALQSMKSSGAAPAQEVAQVTTLVRQSSSEFNKQNYGGALYLAGQAKALAGGSRGRSGGAGAGGSRSGETPFAVPLRLRVTGRGNVREGPGTSFDVVYSIDGGATLTGWAYDDEWIRVTDEHGRSGWIFRSLVGRR